MHRFLGGNGLVAVFAAFIGIAAIAQTAAPGGAPVNVLLMPNTGQQGQTLNVTAQGLPCQGIVSLSFSPPGLQVSGLQCQQQAATLAAAASSPSFTLTISPEAQPGPYTMTAVIYGGQRVVTIPSAFIVTPAPQRAAAPVFLIPNSGQQGQTLNVMAQGLPCSPRLRLTFVPEGLAVSNLQCSGGGLAGNVAGATFTLTISPNAQLGVYTLVASYGNESRRFPAAFTVLPGVPPQGPPPRVDRVAPQDLEPGKTYTLSIYGFAFSPGTTIDFGPDVQNLGPPLIMDTQRAQLTVLVSPSALEGVRLAQARNASGQGNKGPGGIRVVPAKKTTPVISPATGIKLPVQVVKPHGHIVLWAPNHQGSGEFQTVQMGDNPPIVQKDTLFSWYEQNPGVANYFVMSIMDKDGKVLAQAQTPPDKPHYRVTVAFLQNLPDGSTLPMFNWTPPKPSAIPPSVMSALYQPPSASSKSSASSSAMKASLASAGPTQAQMDTLLQAMNSSSSSSMLSPTELHGIMPTGHANALWQVKGFWKNPSTNEEEEVESSDEYPLLLPGSALGLGDCSKAAPGSSIQASAPGSGAVPLAGQPVLVSGQIDITRSPYPISASMSLAGQMQFGGSSAIQYSNLYISWGDGEVDDLRVDSPSPNARTIALTLGGKPLQHAYSKAGDFNIQIYASADPEKHDGSVPGVLRGSSLYSAGLAALLAQPQPASSSEKGSASLMAAPVHVNATSVASSGVPVVAAVSPAAPLAGFLSGANAYLVACTSIEVQEPEDQVANGVLHLKKIAVTSFPGHSENPPQVPDCSDSFTAKATLYYYGKGTIGVTWTVDGVDIPGNDKNIGPGNKSPLASVEIESPPLPVALTGHPHDLKVHAWVISDGYGTSVDGGSGSGGMGASGGSGGSGASTTFMALRPTALGFAALGQTTSSSSSIQASSKASAYSASSDAVLQPSMPLLISVISGDAPERDVTSALSHYDVIPHDPSKPCGITFPTKDGDFTIGDLGSDFTLASDGTASGSGKLHLRLPEGQSGTQDIFVPVTFSNWHLGGSGDGRRVADGAVLDEDVSKDIEVSGLTGTVKHLKATAGSTSQLEVTLHLGVSAFAGLAPLNALQWNVTAPMTPAGDFYSDSLTLASADIGLSGFKLKGVGLVLDLSRTQGTAPSGDTCDNSGTGVAWTGLYVKSGSLELYAFNLPVSVTMPTPDISGWAIGPSGLEGKITSQNLDVTISLGLGDLKIKTMDLSVCGSSLVAKYALAVEHVPLIDTNLDGTFQVDSHGNMATSFAVPSIEKNFSVIDLKLFNADFKNEQNVGWRVAMDVKFKLTSAGNDLYSFNLNGLRVTMDGKIALQGGASSIDLPLGGSAQLGPVKIDIQKLTLLVGAQSGNPYVGFSLTGGVHLSNVLAVSVGNLKYKLIYQGGGFHGEGPTVDSVKVHAQFPDVSPTVTLDVELTYSNSGGSTRFGGQGHLSIVNAVDIQAAFLVGYQGNQDFWMARASIPLGPSGITLFPPFLSLYQLQGGLGHNVPLSALSGTTPLANISPTFDGTYAFMAGARLGSSDGGFTYCFDGTLTIKAGGPDAGFRIDAKAWILTDDHSGNGQFQGFMQYASGSFDAGLSGSWSLMGGAVTITAPSKAVSVHFGSGDWHVYIGQNVDGLKLTAHVLIADCHGYCMLDNTGFRVGGDVSCHLHWGGSLWGFGAHVDASASASIDVAILFGPVHISGDFAASASLSGGLDTPVGCLCISLSGGLNLHAEAMPVSVCGKAWLDFGEICWCLVGCCDHYSVTVGPLCV
jgi:hypothetical protein